MLLFRKKHTHTHHHHLLEEKKMIDVLPLARRLNVRSSGLVVCFLPLGRLEGTQGMWQQ
jgi:hypothetical protein